MSVLLYDMLSLFVLLLVMVLAFVLAVGLSGNHDTPHDF